MSLEAIYVLLSFFFQMNFFLHLGRIHIPVPTCHFGGWASCYDITGSFSNLTHSGEDLDILDPVERVLVTVCVLAIKIIQCHLGSLLGL